jgi:hypothetical protein
MFCLLSPLRGVLFERSLDLLQFRPELLGCQIGVVTILKDVRRDQNDQLSSRVPFSGAAEEGSHHRDAPNNRHTVAIEIVVLADKPAKRDRLTVIDRYGGCNR